MIVVSFLERITRVFGYLAMLIVIPLIVSLIYEVFSRYVLGQPTLWAYEMSYMFMGAIFMLAMAFALLERQHVNVDFLSMNFPVRVKSVIDICNYTIFLIAMVWLSYALIDSTHESYVLGEVSGKSAWNPVIWPFKAIWLAGFVVLSTQILAEIIKSLISLFSGKNIMESNSG